jgi:hypothetical protein
VGNDERRVEIDMDRIVQGLKRLIESYTKCLERTASCRIQGKLIKMPDGYMSLRTYQPDHDRSCSISLMRFSLQYHAKYIVAGHKNICLYSLICRALVRIMMTRRLVFEAKLIDNTRGHHHDHSSNSNHQSNNLHVYRYPLWSTLRE